MNRVPRACNTSRGATRYVITKWKREYKKPTVYYKFVPTVIDAVQNGNINHLIELFSREFILLAETECTTIGMEWLIILITLYYKSKSKNNLDNNL